jgi:calcium-dependent protein kinase
MKAFKVKFNLLITEPEMHKLMKDVAIMNNKTLCFTEFLVAACNRNTLLSEHNLKNAFNYIDDDRDGNISREDLKKFVNINNDYFIGNLIEEADNDCDGVLNY